MALLRYLRSDIIENVIQTFLFIYKYDEDDDES